MNSVFFDIILLGILPALTVILLFIVYQTMKRYFFLKQRIDRISAIYSVNFTKEEIAKDSFKHRMFVLVVAWLRRLHIITNDSAKTYAAQLANAGWLSKNSVVVFLTMQILAILIALLFSLGLVMLVPWFDEKSFLFKAMLVVGVSWLGYRAPGWYLIRSIKVYRRKLRRSFLDFLDLFLICVEAGFSNDKALERVSKELKLLHPELMEQVHLLITELRILPNRKVAWNNFAERTGLTEIKVIVQIINQSEQLGSSISQTLRAQAEIFRSEKMSRIEQKAMRLPTLLTIPLVLFIMPAVLIVVIGPALLNIIGIFRSITS